MRPLSGWEQRLFGVAVAITFRLGGGGRRVAFSPFSVRSYPAGENIFSAGRCP